MAKCIDDYPDYRDFLLKFYTNKIDNLNQNIKKSIYWNIQKYKLHKGSKENQAQKYLSLDTDQN